LAVIAAVVYVQNYRGPANETSVNAGPQKDFETERVTPSSLQPDRQKSGMTSVNNPMMAEMSTPFHSGESSQEPKAVNPMRDAAGGGLSKTDKDL
jgi:hypothetical protein